MAEPLAPGLPMRSPLDGLAPPAGDDTPTGEIALAERRFLGMLDLRLAADAAHRRKAVEAALGLTLPRQPNRVAASGERAALWLAPDAFLVVTAPGEEGPLAAALAPHAAAVSDVSDARAVIELAGGAARDLLAKGSSLDLHPRVFAPGCCARTGLAKTPIILWQLDASPLYRIFVERSIADYLWRWLEDAAAEFITSQKVP